MRAVLWLLCAALLPVAAQKARPVRWQITPEEVSQGGSVRVDVWVSGAVRGARAVFGGRPVILYRIPGGYRGFAGTGPNTPPGHALVRVQVGLAGRQVHLQYPVRVRLGRFGVRYLRVPPKMLDPQLAAYERRRVRQAMAAPLGQPVWDGAFRLPVPGRVVSAYGVRSVYNGVPWGRHLGLDLQAARGTPVRAAQHGVTVLAERLPLGGNTVLVDHGAGVFTSYLHLESVAVRVGQPVRAGQVVGAVGSTGLSTAPHLHWGVWVNGVLVDPLPWTVEGPLARP